MGGWWGERVAMVLRTVDAFDEAVRAEMAGGSCLLPFVSFSWVFIIFFLFFPFWVNFSLISFLCLLYFVNSV